MSLEDKDAIRDVLHTYCQCMDDGRFAELAALFASEGEWVAPYRTARGPEAITAWLTQSVPPTPRRMHYVMNSLITVAGDAAEVRVRRKAEARRGDVDADLPAAIGCGGDGEGVVDFSRMRVVDTEGSDVRQR